VERVGRATNVAQRRVSPSSLGPRALPDAVRRKPSSHRSRLREREERRTIARSASVALVVLVVGLPYGPRGRPSVVLPINKTEEICIFHPSRITKISMASILYISFGANQHLK
jgi:hypothetical protein